MLRIIMRIMYHVLMTTKQSRCKSICRSIAVDCINDNAITFGCTPPPWGHWIEDDAIPEWFTTVRELVDQYLSDGTCSHYCED